MTRELTFRLSWVITNRRDSFRALNRGITPTIWIRFIPIWDRFIRSRDRRLSKINSWNEARRNLSSYIRKHAVSIPNNRVKFHCGEISNDNAFISHKYRTRGNIRSGYTYPRRISQIGSRCSCSNAALSFFLSLFFPFLSFFFARPESNFSFPRWISLGSRNRSSRTKANRESC